MLMDDVGEIGKPGDTRRLAGFDKVQFVVEAVEQGESFGGLSITFIGEIVCFTRETINQCDGAPEALRHQDGGDRKILVMIDSHLVAKTSILNNNLRNDPQENCKLYRVSLK
jgi:hypothetical protein